jgi:hypothetical protein
MSPTDCGAPSDPAAFFAEIRPATMSAVNLRPVPAASTLVFATRARLHYVHRTRAGRLPRFPDARTGFRRRVTAPERSSIDSRQRWRRLADGDRSDVAAQPLAKSFVRSTRGRALEARSEPRSRGRVPTGRRGSRGAAARENRNHRSRAGARQRKVQVEMPSSPRWAMPRSPMPVIDGQCPLRGKCERRETVVRRFALFPICCRHGRFR